MENEKVIRLTEGLSLSDLMSDSGTTFEVNFDDVKEEGDFVYNSENVYDYANPECMGLVDEETYQESGEPFEKISSKMVDIVGNGRVKKRIIRQGYGSTDKLPEKCIVTIDYNAYLEYNDEPFDSTHLRKKPFTFRLDEGHVLPGLEIAVQSMQLNEKSQFLVHPDYAYGKLGCTPRVPANATILYEVELKNYTDSGAAVSYPNLSEEQKNDFAHIYMYAHALCSKGKDLYSKGLIKLAIKEYNIAVFKLENCKLNNYEEQIKQQTLLLRLRSNLVVAHTKVQQPRRACTNYNEINKMCKGTDLKISAKIYFNHARSLMQLSDYVWAERQLKQAYKLEPQNNEISNEFKKLDAKRKESDRREKALAEAIFRNTDKKSQIEVGKEFQNAIVQYCKDLIGDEDSRQYDLPGNLTNKECEFLETEVPKHGLEFSSYEIDGVKKYRIIKASDIE